MNKPVNKSVNSTTKTQIQIEDDRTGMSVETLRRALADNLFYLQVKQIT